MKTCMVLFAAFLTTSVAAGCPGKTGTANAKRCAIEATLKIQAAAIESEWLKQASAANKCPVVSACAPRSDMGSLGPNPLFMPDPIPSDWTAADFDVNFGMTQATYQIDQGSKDPKGPADPSWRTNYETNPPSAARVNKVLCSLKPLDPLWKARKAEVGAGTFWQYYGDQSTGIWYSLPAQGGARCRVYDPRLRPPVNVSRSTFTHWG